MTMLVAAYLFGLYITLCFLLPALQVPSVLGKY